MSLEPIITQIQTWHQEGQKVVLVTGVFDLLHIEHLRFLAKARSSGNKLVVGIETDARVTTIKGPGRPLNSQSIRLEQLESIKSVDLAFILPDKFDTPDAWTQILNDLKPDIYAVSSHTSHLINKRELCRRFNVDFCIVHEHNPEISTTILENKLRT